ncbi:hypothetical protein C8R44DRAFT_884692 [Mycena epipterygia]|nr:hypothetical protein C8R44DRAFT_884692 [Mycena epipterygia]
MPLTMKSSPFETVRNDDALYVDIPPPYFLQEGADRSLSFRAEKRRPEIRPLPQPPAHLLTPDSASLRPLPRRRASGGFFVDLPPPPAKKTKAKARTIPFRVCNPGPSDSPTSPVQRSPHSLLSLNIIPPTPLPPPTPGLIQSRTNLAPPLPDSTAPYPPSPETNHIRTAKMHRRFGGSVGSVPASVLAELRSIGERRPLSRSRSATMPMAHHHTEEDSDSSSSDEDGEHAEEEEYVWSTGKATRGVRPTTRISLKWVQDLGGDRWIADRYASILRAL